MLMFSVLFLVILIHSALLMLDRFESKVLYEMMRCLMEQVVLQRSSWKKERGFSGELKLIDELNAYNEGKWREFRDFYKYLIYGFDHFHAIFFALFFQMMYQTSVLYFTNL